MLPIDRKCFKNILLTIMAVGLFTLPGLSPAEQPPIGNIVPPTYKGETASPEENANRNEPAQEFAPWETREAEAEGPSLEQITSGLSRAFNSPEGKASTKATVTVSLIVGTFMSVRQLFATPITLSELFLLPTRLWGLFAVAVGLRKRLVPWGTVYDSVTKQPIDPAIVILKDRDGNIEEAVTDIDGRYGFLTKPGQYQLSVKKTHYVFPSEKLRGKQDDVIYEDLYFGGDISVKDNEPVVKRDIPMDAVDFDWNEFQKQQKEMAVFSRRAVLVLLLSDTIFYFGLVVSIFAILFKGSLLDIITGLFYAVILCVRLIGRDPRAYGKISRKEDGEPASFAILRVFTEDKFSKIAERVADKYGRYFCLVPAGNRFAVTLDEKKSDGSYEQKAERILEARMGIIKKHFRI